MRWTRTLVLALLVVPVVLGCKTANVAAVSAQTLSPQRVGVNDPPEQPADPSAVSQSTWCHLTYQGTSWILCNIHYHRPAEHGTRIDNARYVTPPCDAENTTPEDWVEIHYAYVRGAGIPECDLLRETSLTSILTRHCSPPFIVRSVWARVTPDGTFQPKTDDLPDSRFYIEYDGTATGSPGTCGTLEAHWKMNRDCLRLTDAALVGVTQDPTCLLQPEAERPWSTVDPR